MFEDGGGYVARVGRECYGGRTAGRGRRRKMGEDRGEEGRIAGIRTSSEEALLDALPRARLIHAETTATIPPSASVRKASHSVRKASHSGHRDGVAQSVEQRIHNP